MTWFEKKNGGFDFEFKLNQVHLPLIHNNYMIKTVDHTIVATVTLRVSR
jgi:hypothetical protein